MITTSVLGAFFGLVILAGIIGALFMYVGAKLAMVEKATLGRSLLAAFGSSAAGWAFTALFYSAPLLGSCSGFMIGLAASVVVIKLVFDTDTSKAFTVLVFHLLAQIVAFLLTLITFGPGLHSYLTVPLPPG